MSTHAIEAIQQLTEPGYIISIYYRPVVLLNNPLNIRLEIPALPRASFNKGEYLSIRVPAMSEFIEIPATTRRQEVFHSGYTLAKSLWEDNIAGCYHSAAMSTGITGDNAVGLPGLMYSDKPELSLEDRERLANGQISFADGWLREADGLFHSDRAREINANMYDAAAWLGVDVEWARRKMQSQVEMKDCQWCGEKIPKKVAICAKCHNIVDVSKFELLKAQFAVSGLATSGDTGSVATQSIAVPVPPVVPQQQSGKTK